MQRVQQFSKLSSVAFSSFVVQHDPTALGAQLSAAGTACRRVTAIAARRSGKHPLASQFAWFKLSVRPLGITVKN
jgi:hypothetical protein